MFIPTNKFKKMSDFRKIRYDDHAVAYCMILLDGHYMSNLWNESFVWQYSESMRLC
jgi:hypothetical protein